MRLILQEYLNLSTSKRETSSPSTRKQLGIYWNKFIESNYSVSYSGLRDWLISINLSSSSKKSISGSLARMMYTYELISKDEYDRLRHSFKAKSNSWSEKVLSDADLIEFFNLLITMKIDKFYILRNLTLFMLLLITGMRIGQALDLTIEDISLTSEYIKLTIRTAKKNDTNTRYQNDYTLSIPNTSGYKQINLRNLIEVYLDLRSKTVPKDTIVFLCTKGGNTIDAENEITNGMWKLEQIEDHIKTKLKSYGKTIETDPMDQNPSVVGEVCRAIDLVISGDANSIHVVCRESPSNTEQLQHNNGRQYRDSVRTNGTIQKISL